MAGSEVEMTVPSMFSMNRAVAMMKAVRMAERIGGFQAGAFCAGAPPRKAKARYRGHNRLNADTARTDPSVLRNSRRKHAPQPPNTTLFMIRPGASVNKPVTTSARVKIQIIAER